MTPACQFRRGFFTLRTCDRPAMKQCENCGQSACPFHLSVPSGMSVCVDCYSQQPQQEVQEDYDDNWVYSYRSSYYRSGYRPFMYSQQDHRSFDSSADEIDNFEDDYAGGDFSDS
jgi:recombinational DNA repair protein (RecF pathway)